MRETKLSLFLRLANPDENGVSRWVSTDEFIGEYAGLAFGNGASWARRGSTLCKEYKVEFDKSVTPGNSIDCIRLNGFNKETHFSQAIRPDIREYYRQRRCVMLGVCGTSENTRIEIDHKDGRKSDERVANLETQRLEDFQPLCKAANDIKRQICKECKETNRRWNAQLIKGNPYPFYKGGEEYTEEDGCVGCYQYDPVAYRRECVRRISDEACQTATQVIMQRLYPDEFEEE